MRLARWCLVSPLLAFAVACSSPAAPPSPSPAATESIDIKVREGTTLAFDLSPDGRSIVFDLLGELWRLPAGGGAARPLTDAVRDTAEDLDPSWSPDGRSILFRAERRGRTGLWLLAADSAGARPRQLTQLERPEGYDGDAAWSPDGKTIAFARIIPPSGRQRPRSRVELLDVAGGAVRELPVADTTIRYVSDPAWEPGGRRLAVVAAPARTPYGGRIWAVETATGTATPLTPAAIRAHAPSFSPDGKRIAFFAPDSARRTQLWVSSADGTGAPNRLTGHADVTPTRARWTADGRALVYTADGRLWRVSAAGGEPSEIPFTAELSFTRPRRSLPPPPFPEAGRTQPVRAFMGLALSPDAGSVAMLALGKLWVMPVHGTPRAVADVPPSAHHPAWSPDGGTIAWSAGGWKAEDVFATDLATGTTRRVTALAGGEDSPAFSPDGKNLVFLHQPSENQAVIRIVSAGATEVSDTAATRAIAAEPGAEVSWTPSSDLLYLTGGFAPGDSTKVEIVRLSGERRDAGRKLDSPLLLRWTANAAVFIRHARLWRAPFDTAGRLGPAEPIGAEPAMYPSLARDGSILFISDGGLHLRSPDGREETLGWPLSYTPPVPAPVLIRNVRIIDGTGSPASAARDILVERGRISRIAGSGTIRAPAAQVVDGSGGFVIPGMMDLHAHEYRPALLPGFSYFGVTTVRDQGSDIAPIVAYADLIAAGKLDGPRVDYGGFQFYSDWAYDTEDGQGVEPEADPAHLARAVALARIFGSQHIKTRTFRRWDINARFIAEAHRLGMRVTGHCSHLLPLVAAGMDAKEHVGFCEPRGDGLIYDDLVQLFRAAGIGVVPTISYSSLAVLINEHPHALEADSELRPFLPEQGSFNWMMRLDSAGHRQFQQYAEWSRRATLRWQRAGVTIGTGTDIWQIPTGVHMELEEMVAAGLSPLEAIHAATAGSARIVGIDRDLGTVEVGKWADLVILDADPSADIRNTRRIRAVLQAGRVVDRAAILRRVRGG
jgi:Tol biopolymer transport system component/imidazolonepropionase-like amidohydrolase